MSQPVPSVAVCWLGLQDTIFDFNQSGSIKVASGWWTDIQPRLPPLSSSANVTIRRNLITEVFHAACDNNDNKKPQTGCTGDLRANCHFPHLECAHFHPHAPSPISLSPFEFLPSSTGENHSVPCHPANV